MKIQQTGGNDSRHSSEEQTRESETEEEVAGPCNKEDVRREKMEYSPNDHVK